MKTSLISIVLPIYNAEKYLNECINSILEQTYAHFELIVVNDGSTDNSLNIINKYKDQRIKIIENKHNFIKSLNLGIKEAKGAYIARMNADDIMLPHRLETQFNYMESNPKVDICGSWAKTFGSKSYIMKPPVHHQDIVLNLLLNNALLHSTIMMRKDAVYNCPQYPNLYKQKYLYAEDYKLWTELAINGYRFANIPDVLLKYRRSDTQVTSVHFFKMTYISNIIQKKYFEKVAEKIIETDIDQCFYNLFDNAIKLVNKDLLSFSRLKHVVFDIYGKHLYQKNIQNKIKVLFCIHTLSGGGAEKLLIDILKNIDYDNYYVDLLVLSDEGGVYFNKIPSEVKWFTLDHTDYHSSYDIEIAFLEGLATKFIAKRNSNAKKIAWVHTDLFNHHCSKAFFKNRKEEITCYQLIDQIIFVSNDAKLQFMKLYPTISTPQKVIYNLIDRQEIRKKASLFNVTKCKLTLCCVGRLVEPKGYLRLIPIIKRLIQDHLLFEVWILGNGGQMQDIISLINNLNLSDIIHLKGFQANPYPYIKSADIYVCSSYSEGFSLTTAEALCLNKPIVATNCTGPRELLEDGKYGMIVEQDEESIYQGLKDMLSDEKLRIHYSKKANRRSGIFDVKGSMSQIYNALNEDK